MSEGIAEFTHIENAFGTVTDRRVIYFRSKGWFSGGSKEVLISDNPQWAHAASRRGTQNGFTDKGDDPWR